MSYLDLGSERVYYEIAGTGEPVVLLHGGYCSLETMREIGKTLEPRFQVVAAERAGHGRTADRDGPYSYATMVQETLDFLAAVGIEKAHLVGFSDGAIVALLMARDHPDTVSSFVAISANTSTDGFVPDDFPHDTVPDEATNRTQLEYEQLSPDGPEHAKVVLEKLMTLWRAEPDIPLESLASVRAPALIVAGEFDVVRLDHTEAIAAAVPNARLRIVPGVTHMLVVEQPGVVAELVGDFLADNAEPRD